MSFYNRPLKYDFDQLQDNPQVSSSPYSKELFSKRHHVLDVAAKLEALFGPDGEYPFSNVAVFSEHEQLPAERYGISYYRFAFHIDNGLPAWFGAAITKLTDLIRDVSSCNSNDDSCSPGRIQLFPYTEAMPGLLGYLDLILEEHLSAEEKSKCDKISAGLVSFFEPIARANDALVESDFLGSFSEVHYKRAIEEIAKTCARFTENCHLETDLSYMATEPKEIINAYLKFEIKPGNQHGNVCGLHSHLKAKPRGAVLDLMDELHHIWLDDAQPKACWVNSSSASTASAYRLEIKATRRAL